VSDEKKLELNLRFSKYALARNNKAAAATEKKRSRLKVQLNSETDRAKKKTLKKI